MKSKELLLFYEKFISETEVVLPKCALFYILDKFMGYNVYL